MELIRGELWRKHLLNKVQFAFLGNLDNPITTAPTKHPTWDVLKASVDLPAITLDQQFSTYELHSLWVSHIRWPAYQIFTL